MKSLLVALFMSVLSTQIPSSALAQNQVLSITGLTEDAHSSSAFKGIEETAAIINSDTKRASILYLHGIGWTQNGNLAADFTQSLARFYGTEFFGVDKPRSGTKCLQSDVGSGIKIRTNLKTNWFQTDLKNEHLWINQIGCMDRLIVNRGGETEFYIYRLFWDNNFWNAIQHGYVGYDDFKYYGDVKTDPDKPASVQPRHQRIAELREGEIRYLKDNIINYGFSDSALYIGPAGDLMREAVATALCLAAKDTNKNSIFEQVGRPGFKSEHRVTNRTLACNTSDAPTKELAIISESMGSRIIYDVFQDTHFSKDNKLLGDLIQKEPEVYMLANQIPLIGVGEIEKGYKKQQISASDPRKAHLIAFSDVNDLLTYELVPYMHQLWLRSYSSGKNQGQSHKSRNVFTGGERSNVGHDLATMVGFNITDVRTNFGNFNQAEDKFAESLRIHQEMIKEDEVIQLILCGAVDGEARGKFGDCRN